MKEKNIQIPKLKTISIKNYDLYNNGGELYFEFVEGLNLLLGGNGTGKTTFINILQYALCGAYTGTIDYRRRSKLNDNDELMVDELKTRYQLSDQFFRNRMRNHDEKAEVTITFSLGHKSISVTRSLFDNIFKYLQIDGKEYHNQNALTQRDYERMRKNRRESRDEIYRIYEMQIIQNSHYKTYDDYINFVMNVLIFDERRKTFLWNHRQHSDLMNSYTAPEELELEYKQAFDLYKLHDSKSRHESENAKPFRRLLKSYDGKKSDGEETLTEVDEKIQKLIKLIVKENYHKEEILNQLKSYYLRKKSYLTNINNLKDTVQALSNSRNEILLNELSEINTNINPHYYDYRNQFISSSSCPMCYSVVNVPIEQSGQNCFMCGSELNNYSNQEKASLSSIDDQVQEVYKKISNNKKSLEYITSDINSMEKVLADVKRKIVDLEGKKIDLEIQLSELKKSNDQTKKVDTENEYKLLLKTINEFESKMEYHKNLSKDNEKHAFEILSRIDKYKISVTHDISKRFSEYVDRFIKLHGELIYPTDNEMLNYIDVYDLDVENNARIYVPLIDHIPRIIESELSESQRFFIDQSFRFAIFDFFNKNSSLFICETPDSSLDISFEINAAEVYLNFVNNKSNTLIISSNFNDGVFLKHLITNTEVINFINFYKCGRTNDVQRNSDKLLELSEEIEGLIYEKGK